MAVHAAITTQVTTMRTALTLDTSDNVSTQPMGAARSLGRVLLVEDEGLLALELDRRLTLAGFEVVGVADRGEDALRLASAQRPDVVLMDIFIRGARDGIDTAHALTKLYAVPVVFMTDHHDEVTLTRALEVSPYGYLLKPLEQRAMCAALRVAILQASRQQPAALAHAAFMAADNALLIVALDGDRRPTIALCNDAASRLSQSWRMGEGFSLGPPSDPVVARLMDALAAREAADGVLRHVAQDGSRRWSVVTLSPLRGADDQARHMFVTRQDITDLRDAELLLAEHQRAQLTTQLTAGVAHDFNNILQAILAFADMARDGLPESTPRADLEQVMQAAERGATLTRKLLQQARKAQREAAPLELAQQLELLYPTCAKLAGPLIRCTLSLKDAPIESRIAASALEQLLLNLVANARDAMPAGGTLRIGLFREGPHAIIEVEDSGVGIAPALLDKIFEPFFTTKDEERGTGLGLATCKALVAEANGQIAVRSAPGAGTTMRLTLPALAPSTLTPNAHVAGALCLLVDPDPEQRAASARALTGAGFRMIEAITGEEACRKLEVLGSSLRLLVCEHTLPDMTGRAVAQSARLLAPGAASLILAAEAAEVTADEVVLWRPCSSGTLVRAALDALMRDDATPIRSAITHRRSVLLVERDPASRKALSAMLSARELDVIECAHIDEAAASLASQPISAVVVDASMVGVEAMERIGFVRRIDPLVPTVVIINDESQALAERVLRGQATVFLRKPLPPGLFATQVELLLDQGWRASRQRELARQLLRVTPPHTLTPDALHDALTNQQKTLAYQPVLRIHDDVVIAYEPVWRHGDNFLTIAALITAWDDTAPSAVQARRALRGHTALALRQRPEFEGAMLVAITPHELLAGTLLEAAEPLRADAPRMMLELNAHQLLHEHDAVRAALDAHRDAGYMIALSALGDGHNGLELLDLVQPKLARLDASLVRDLHRHTLSQQLVRSLIHRCRRDAITLVGAEVESLEEATSLKDLGCDCVQGRFIAYPTPDLPRPLRKLSTNF